MKVYVVIAYGYNYGNDYGEEYTSHAGSCVCSTEDVAKKYIENQKVINKENQIHFEYEIFEQTLIEEKDIA